MPADLKYGEWEERYVKAGNAGLTEAGEGDIIENREIILDNKRKALVENLGENDIINSGAVSGARNPYGKSAEKHSKQYYQFIRTTNSDVPKISKNTGYDESLIAKIKKYLFVEKHDLGDGMRQFDPDFMIAQSWQRLIEGKNILPHDMTLLLHEKLEQEFINEGMPQYAAHIKASEKYNYTEEAGKYYASIKKYTKE